MLGKWGIAFSEAGGVITWYHLDVAEQIAIICDDDGNLIDEKFAIRGKYLPEFDRLMWENEEYQPVNE